MSNMVIEEYKSMTALLTFLFITIQIVAVHCQTQNVSEECLNWGFNKAVVKCSSCHLLPQFHLESLQHECLQCCQSADEEPVIRKYAKARLEICTCRFGAYPQIQAFIKSDLPKQHSNLQIRFINGRDPIIKLIDENDEIKEVVAIDKWNTDSVDEFLRTHLHKKSQDYLNSNLI